MKTLKYKLLWKYRKVMLHFRGYKTLQTVDLLGVTFLEGKRKGDFIPYGEGYSKLWFSGYIL